MMWCGVVVAAKLPLIIVIMHMQRERCTPNIEILSMHRSLIIDRDRFGRHPNPTQSPRI